VLVQSLVVSSAGAVGPLLFALVLCRMVFCSSLLVVLVADVLVSLQIVPLSVVRVASEAALPLVQAPVLAVSALDCVT